MRSPAWAGVFSAIVTPFAPDGRIEWDQFGALIDLLAEEGVAGLVVAGSTGEYYSQSIAERTELFQFAKRYAAGRLTLIAGTSALGAAETLSLTRTAKDIGFDGCMVLPPTYCLPTPAETRAYFEQVAAIGLPVMIYNNPPRVGISLSPALTAELASIPNIVAYKESARDL